MNPKFTALRHDLFQAVCAGCGELITVSRVHQTPGEGHDGKPFLAHQVVVEPCPRCARRLE